MLGKYVSNFIGYGLFGTIIACLGFILVLAIRPNLIVDALVTLDSYRCNKYKPPENISIERFLKWHKKPLRANRINYKAEFYFHFSGDTCRVLASGPVGYSFNSKGELIGWTEDSGDFHIPKFIYSKDAIWERTTVGWVKDYIRKLENSKNN